jgi:hypothetical protein
MLSTRTRFNSYNYDLIPKKHKSTCDIYSQKSPAGQQEEAVEMMGVCDTLGGLRFHSETVGDPLMIRIAITGLVDDLFLFCA